MKKLLAVATLFASVPALAQVESDAGFYAGAGIGSVNYTEDLGAGFEFDDNSTAWKAIVGYSFNRNFALEGSYLTISELADSIGNISVTLDGIAWQASAVGSWWFTDRAALIGKAGAIWYDVDAQARLGNLTSSTSDSDNDFVFGVGLQLGSDRTQFRVEYELVKFDVADLQLLTASVLFRF